MINSRSIFVLILIVSGCATVPREQQLNFQGNVAVERGNYQAAIENFEQAYEAANESGNTQYAAIAAYGLGRSYGYSCSFDRSVEWFKKSIALRKAIPDSRIAYLSQNYLELARLYFSRQRWSDAIDNFDHAMPLLQSQNVETTDPIGYSRVLEIYRDALVKAGKGNRAKQIESQIRALQAANPGVKARFIAQPYPEQC